MPMKKWWARGTWVVTLLALGACASSGGGGDRTASGAGRGPGAPVPVTDLKTVVGHWAGLMDLPGNAEDQYLEVTVREDGTYRAKSARTIGVMDVEGTVAVSDGRLLLQGRSGSRGTATLFSRDGQPTLMVDMTAVNRNRTTARLRPQP
jgi:hypothetical protein